MLRAKNYVKAKSLEEAYELNQKKSSVLIGGFIWLKMGERRKQTIIDLSLLGLDKITETEEEFRIGAMCTLRDLEMHPGLNGAFQGIFRESVRHIVGVQLRNCATVGGSIFGRFGFSDVLTCFLGLDTYVELYKGGIVPLREFAKQKKDRDILVSVLVKKDGRRAAYFSERNTKTDFPTITCCVAETDSCLEIAVGARPARAEVIGIPKESLAEGNVEAFAEAAADRFTYGSNLRASAPYRRQLAKVCIKRALLKLQKGEA